MIPTAIRVLTPTPSQTSKRLRSNSIGNDPPPNYRVLTENTLIALNTTVLKEYIEYYNKNYRYYAKMYNITKTGNKKRHIDNILLWQKINRSAETIQRTFRGSLVRKWIYLRGIGLKNRQICVNETDFCTLEPINEIANEDFFSYTDAETQCTFGFDIRSLWALYKKKGITLTFPYTKSNISNVNYFTATQMKKHNRLIMLNVRESLKHNIYILSTKTIKHPYNRTILTKNDPMYKNAIDLFFIMKLRQSIPQPPVDLAIVQPQHTTETDAPTYSTVNILRCQLQTRILEVRNKPLLQRIHEVFMEINCLDNYTDVEWFFNMSKVDCYRFIYFMKHIWTNGYGNGNGRILDDTKHKICFLHEPFFNMNTNFGLNDKTFEEIQEHAIYVMENFVHLGINNEYRRQGAFLVLTALTLVSMNARVSLSWLFENYTSN